MKRLLLFLLVSLFPIAGFSQGGGGVLYASGSYGSAGYGAQQNQPRPQESANTANESEFIAITGTAEVSVKPESLRIVFAVTAEADTSLECSRLVKERIANIREALTLLDIESTKVVEDFIVVVPSFTWELQTKEKTRFVKEVPDGFRLQSNLHILCKDDAQAMAVIDTAFASGVTEIISFDYWHSQLDEQK